MHFLEYPWFDVVSGLVIAYCANRFAGLRERSLELAAKRRKIDGKESASDLDDLRAELMRLRETSTQYDLSVERALTEIARRLASLEQRTGMPAQEPLPLIAAPDEKRKKNSAVLTIPAPSEQKQRAGRK